MIRSFVDSLHRYAFPTHTLYTQDMLLQLPGDAVALIGLALIFDFLNGFHDSSNIVATMISSRAIGPRFALLITAVAEAVGPFLFGVAVARTIGSEIVAETAVSMPVLMSALIAAIGWNVFTWLAGIPSSSSHALIGGIVGATIAGSGLNALEWIGLGKVVAALLISPPIGLLAGYLLMKMILFLARGATPRINVLFKRGQVATALALALSHGTNDAQKTMGIITLGLVISGALPAFDVPVWVIAISAGAIALGASLGGWRLIRTLGAKFYTIRPVHGFTAQVASATVILGAALLGGPVSTTQVVSSSILGVGSAERLSKVRWGVAQQIGVAWLLTIPMSALLAAGIYVVIP
ncbi:MAG: inorganic phosphate transporter [Anaerolineae bacterium]